MIRRTAAAGLAALTLFTLAACSSDSKSSDKGGDGTSPAASETTLGGGDTGGTLPGGVTIPNVPGVSPECMALVQAIAASSTALTGTGDYEQAAQVLQAMENAVPDDLKDDARIFAEAYTKFLDVMKKYNGDFTKLQQDPEAMAELEALDSPEVQAAGDAISNYIDSTCNTGS